VTTIDGTLPEISRREVVVPPNLIDPSGLSDDSIGYLVDVAVECFVSCDVFLQPGDMTEERVAAVAD